MAKALALLNCAMVFILVGAASIFGQVFFVNRTASMPIGLYLKSPQNRLATGDIVVFKLVGDVGHTLIFGPTGSGKSTLLSFSAAQWLRYPSAQVFMFDKGCSSRVLTECIGGAFFSIGAKDDELCFQPLRNIDTQEERIWAAEWLYEMIQEQGYLLTSDVRTEIWQALMNLAEQERSSRTLTVFNSLVQDENVREALQPFTLTGPYGYLFDNAEEKSCFNSWQVFETAELFEQKTAVKPALSYLFHRLSKRFDGKPTTSRGYR